MRLKDIAELIRCDLLDLTEGAFDVQIKSDDAGYHLAVYLESHEDAADVRKALDKDYKGTRTVILKIPEGTLDFVRIEIVRKD